MNTILKYTSLLSISCIAALAASPAVAQDLQNSLGPVRVSAPPKPITGQRAINLIALETNTTPRQARMVVEHDPAMNYHYPSEIRTDMQIRQALGEERYSALIGGEPIQLYSEKVTRAVHAMTASNGASDRHDLSVATTLVSR